MSEFLKKPEEIKNLTDIKGGCLVSSKITVDGEKIGNTQLLLAKRAIL